MIQIRLNVVFILSVGFSFLLSSSSMTLYPPLDELINSLYWNSSLPQCNVKKCLKAMNQAEFPRGTISQETLLKLSSYENRTAFYSPLLVSSTGIYRGKRLEYNGRFVDQFLGIFYAEKPTIFKKPVRKSFSYKISDATKFSPCCLQSLSMAMNLSYGSFMMQHDFDENCLSLNIYRPDLRYGEKSKAILLFSHGGSNQLGSGSLFDGSILASEGDIIVITMNYRLNYHGFFSTGDERLEGNFGLWDQLLAIEWIYENAHLFGGDRRRITLSGHSAGAGNVMLIPASRFCRGMIRRVISQSGNGLAPWSINHQPLKLFDRFSKDFNCSHENFDETIDCISKLFKGKSDEIYRLHISLDIADDNPYPVIDKDFLDDSMEKLIQTDAFHNVDFLTGVTLSEGLYFAEYHIRNSYLNMLNRTLFENQNQTGPKPIQKFDPNLFNQSNFSIESFRTLNFIENYIEANFDQADCVIKEVQNHYNLSDQTSVEQRIKLYIDLVSDLMFNYHMVLCLNSLSKVARRNATNYAYIYSHRPSSKIRSTFRDQMKILPDVVGHFAELDYVFGVPLLSNNQKFHRNVNFSYCNYSRDERQFSHVIIQYWSNFVKTGNPNQGSLYNEALPAEWHPYKDDEHNYFNFQLKNLRNEKNYFDSMFQFWNESFRIEREGVCPNSKTNGKSIPVIHLRNSALVFMLIFGLLVGFSLGHFCKQKRKKTNRLLSSESGHILTQCHNASA